MSSFWRSLRPISRWPISRFAGVEHLQTRTSIEFSSPAVFVFGVQTCEPGTHRGSHLLCPHYPAHASTDAAFGPLAHTARCEPQTLQTLFSDRTVAQCCAVAPRIGFSAGRTPFAWGDGVTKREGITVLPDHNNRRRSSLPSQPSRRGGCCDDGDGCDGRCLLFTPASTQVLPMADARA